ncbi:SGNH/GDSL hydrolase family protein [Paludisphaera rhizosphaerae]|uniref:SGNH/GDSL hydrolase family protein n=1 Tax=Paludisphaera rhizosphaerae TaxID=2711216 RepID=UPI0013EABF46|nr:GDSL-type esterase/lipase family protein [Paludisphaera rhizosphaerae]
MTKPAQGHGAGMSSAKGRADALSFVACLVILAASAFGRENDWVRAAQGKTRLGRELGAMQTRGYYEALIDANRDADPDAPPPGWVPFGASGIAQPTEDYIHLRLRPNADLVWNGARFRTNSKGYRTPEVALPKPHHVYRIVFFGSSNTMGHGVGDDEAYPRLMEPWLDGATDPATRVEVVNLSVSGDSPSRRLSRMVDEAAGYQPDWILCDATVLDPALEEMHLEAIVRAEPRPEIPPVLDYVRQALDRCGASPTDPPDVLRGKLQGQAESILQGGYRGWAEFAQSAGVPMTIVMIPRADAKLASPAVEKVMRSAVLANGLDVIDLSHAFQSLSVDEFRVSPWDKHPSVKGHRAIFEAFREAMLVRGKLPGLELLR